MSFRIFPQLNDLDDTAWMSSRTSFNQTTADRYFTADTLPNKLVHAIAAEHFFPLKEVFECFEFFARIRKTARSSVVADLCCGHGLLGILFAVFERKVERVILVDKEEPPSRARLIACATKVAPWIEPKLTNVAARIALDSPWLESGCSIVSAHACGLLSDLCIDIALEVQGDVALLPCCYPSKLSKAPGAILRELGPNMAFDIDRTYRLEAAGYRVKWSAIPDTITPMNRVLIGTRWPRT